MKISKRSTPIRSSSSSFKSIDFKEPDSPSSSVDTLELEYESGIDRYAQRARPPLSSPQKRAIWHYQQALNLKNQRSTHAPFYFHELGQEKSPSSESSPLPIPAPLRPLRYKPTNFYPGGPDDGGALEAISPVARTQFQRVLPRYEYSTAHNPIL